FRISENGGRSSPRNRDHAASADRDRPLRWALGPGWGPSAAARRRDAAIGPLGAQNQGRPLASLPDSCGLLPGIRSRRFQRARLPDEVPRARSSPPAQDPEITGDSIRKPMPFRRVFRCVSVGSCAPRLVFSRLEVVIKIGIVVMDPKSYLALVEDRDTPLLLQALHRAGVSAEAFSWHDREVDWSQLDLAVLRTPWDYSQQPAAFDAWLEHAAARTRVLNQPELVRWNMDKHYLDELATVGIAGVPTTFLDQEDSLRTSLAGHAGQQIVLKPSVSAGSRHTGLFGADDPAALELGRQILAGGRTVMLQPEVPELSAGQEKALYAIEGHYTH